MVALIGAVAANTYVIDRKIYSLHESLAKVKIDADSTALAQKAVADIFEKYRSSETYISLTVNHDDLTNIEDNFAELIGNLSVGDSDGAAITKSRLLCSLEHLRRLSGINIDSII